MEPPRPAPSSAAPGRVAEPSARTAERPRPPNESEQALVKAAEAARRNALVPAATGGRPGQERAAHVTGGAEPVAAHAAQAAHAAPAIEAEDGFPLWPSLDATAEVQVLEGASSRPAEPVPRESLDEWPPPLLRAALQNRSSRSAPPRKRGEQRPLRHLRRPASGLATLLLVALLSGFFAWTSAEPFWLAVGHAHAGTLTVDRCAGNGLLRRCVGTFTGGGFTAEGVTVLGAHHRPGKKSGMDPGVKLSARMVGPAARIAYAGSTDGLHVRWAAGLALTTLCGILVAWATGARRLVGRRARYGAVLLSFAGPLALFLGMLVATF